MSQKDQTKLHAILKKHQNFLKKDQLMATNGAKDTCAYVHEGFPEQNTYKCFHNRNVSTQFLIDLNRATTKPNQTIFFLKPNQIKRIARATISHQTKWGTEAKSKLLNPVQLFARSASGRTRKHSRRGGREWTGSRMEEDIWPPSTLG